MYQTTCYTVDDDDSVVVVVDDDDDDVDYVFFQINILWFMVTRVDAIRGLPASQKIQYHHVKNKSIDCE